MAKKDTKNQANSGNHYTAKDIYVLGGLEPAPKQTKKKGKKPSGFA